MDEPSGDPEYDWQLNARVSGHAQSLWSIKELHLSAVITRSIFYDITYGTAITVAECELILESQQTPHISPSRASYGVSIARI